MVFEQAVTIMQEALLRELGAEVDLIFRFGSYLKGNTHKYSDLDIAYVPVHNTTYHSITVLVDDKLIDLFPVHWSWLEQLADFSDVRCTLLLEAEIVYQRSDDSVKRFHELATQLRASLEPDAYPQMLNKAQGIFQRLGYQYYLLQQHAQNKHRLACMQHSRNILNGVFHTLAVCNQQTIDTRKWEQLTNLSKLPKNFANTVERIINTTEPDELLTACETLMDATRALLLTEQAKLLNKRTFAEVFGPGYPELKGDIQHIILACERNDRLSSNFLSLYHELMIHMAQALTGIGYSGFNSIADYEQDLVALGFPDLLAYVVAKDFDGLKEQCLIFDQRLQAFLTERDVLLYSFKDVDELQEHLE